MNLEEADSLSEQIAKYISEQIISGELVEGERIQELRIAKELDVSRGSVREALLLLERTYLIEIFPRRGAIVSEMSAQQVKLCLIPMSWYLGILCNELVRLGELTRLNSYRPY
jgi:DNA-binding GntR family transcriptional regulator